MQQLITKWWIQQPNTILPTRSTNNLSNDYLTQQPNTTLPTSSTRNLSNDYHFTHLSTNNLHSHPFICKINKQNKNTPSILFLGHKSLYLSPLDRYNTTCRHFWFSFDKYSINICGKLKWVYLMTRFNKYD